ALARRPRSFSPSLPGRSAGTSLRTRGGFRALPHWSEPANVMNLVVDLNSDLGEGAGHDNEILDLVSSANIACGFHAGDPASIFATIQAALERAVSLGAHPSFPDRENFGRTEMTMPPAEVYSTVAYQIGGFHALARAAGGRMNHV